MKKIGLVTPFKVPNYGTKLQAYAITTYFASFSEVFAEIINYNPSKNNGLFILLRKVFSLKKNVARLKKWSNKFRAHKDGLSSLQKERVVSINAFDENFKLSSLISSFKDLQKKANDYDCLICGSDQIWLPGNLNDKYYTLEFCDNNGVKKGSYAASLGVEQLTNKEKNRYALFLEKLDFISLRENIGQEIIASICPQKKVSWVCDPTFLLPTEKWQTLERKPKILDEVEGKYIFCYFLGVEEFPRKAVYEYAQKNGYKILTVANFKGVCDADSSLTDVQLYNLSVNEFLYMINHSHLVCTDSMHATIFSIIFKKEFATFERFKKSDGNSRNSRIYSLLHVMGLENRLVEFGSVIPTDSIDYNLVEEKKNYYISSSKKFIETEIFSCL